MKKFLPFCFLLIFVTAQSQVQVTLKFIRPSITVGSSDKIQIKVMDVELALDNGTSNSVNVSPDFSSSLEIECSFPNGLKTNYFLEVNPNQTYVFEVGPKKTGIYIKLLASVNGLNGDYTAQTSENATNNSWDTKLKVDRKTKGISFSGEKEGETQGIRDDWMKQGGTVKMSSQLLTLVYFRSDMGDLGVINGYGYGFSLAQNQINLKVPQFKEGMSNWSSLNLGAGMDMNTYAFKTESNISGISMKMDMRNLSLMFVGNLGWTFGLGKFLDASNWKGVAITLKYRPAINMTVVKTTTKTTAPIVGTTTSTTSSNSTTFNAGGFGFDWEFSNFTSTMNKIAPPPRMKFSFFILPPVKSSPLFISFSLGIVTYGVPKRK